MYGDLDHLSTLLGLHCTTVCSADCPSSFSQH